MAMPPFASSKQTLAQRLVGQLDSGGGDDNGTCTRQELRRAIEAVAKGGGIGNTSRASLDLLCEAIGARCGGGDVVRYSDLLPEKKSPSPAPRCAGVNEYHASMSITHNEYHAQLPDFSQRILAAAPHLGLVDNSSAVTMPCQAQPSPLRAGASMASVIASALPDWLLDVMRPKQRAMERHFQKWASTGVTHLQVGAFAHAVKEVCGVQLSDSELTVVLRCVSDPEQREPPPEHSSAALRAQEFDCALLGRALQRDWAEAHSAQHRTANQASPGKRAQAWPSKRLSQSSPGKLGSHHDDLSPAVSARVSLSLTG